MDLYLLKFILDIRIGSGRLIFKIDPGRLKLNYLWVWRVQKLKFLLDITTDVFLRVGVSLQSDKGWYQTYQALSTDQLPAV